MDRRNALIGLGCLGAAAALPAAIAQPSKKPRIGVLTFDPATEIFRREFGWGLRDQGYVEGKNIFVEWRSTREAEQANSLALDLVRLKVDVIVATPTPAVQAARKATNVIPIVMVAGDALGAGFVASLARPGGNTTGISSLAAEVGGKLLELLRELRPAMSRVALLLDTNAYAAPLLKQIQSAAKPIGVRIQSIVVQRDEELDGAFAMMVKEHADAVIVQGTLAIKHVADLATKHRLPSITSGLVASAFTEIGGLMHYGPTPTEYRRAAVYVDKILKGANPADLPVEQPTKIALAINLRTAKALGLKVPKELLFRADEVIR